MDELIFRGSQRLETLHLQADLVASKTKQLLETYSRSSGVLFAQLWNSTKFEQLKYNFVQLVNYLLEISQDFKERALDVADPKRLWIYLGGLLDGRWSRREVGIACAGFLVGGVLGVAIGFAWRKRDRPQRYMEAIQISHYMGIEAANVVEDAVAPYECGDYDVLINVKAGSVQMVDAQICRGYGRSFRRILRNLHERSRSDLPVILGRDCTGVITDLGKGVRRLEIGDEVWATLPFWSQGALSQTLIVSENRVARKPKNVGFEGACSLPYAGALALSALAEAGIDIDTVTNKRFLIQDGCTPVGCVLIQLLNSWKAHVTTSCYKRAVPVAKALGAKEIISIEENLDGEESFDLSKATLKELEARGDVFDVIILTRIENLNLEDLSNFSVKDGKILSTMPEKLLSDSCGYFTGLFLAAYVRLKFLFESVIGLPHEDYDEAHLCHATLDKLTELVEEGVLQTVVDKVFQPKDIEVALHYIQSAQSIGSSVISFR